MEPQPQRPWWQIGCAAVLGVLLAVGVGVALGMSTGGPAAPVTAQEHRIVVSQARMAIFENPFERLLQLSYRVDRIADPEPGPCVDEMLAQAAGGADDAAWHVTAYGPFGVPMGAMTLTCSGASRD